MSKIKALPGSQGCVPKVSKVSVFDGLRRVRFFSRGLDGAGSGNRVPRTGGIEKVPGSEGSVSKSYCMLWRCVYVFSKCTFLVWTLFFVVWKYAFLLSRYTSVLRRRSILSYFEHLARAKTRDTPAPLRHAATASLISRWTAFLTRRYHNLEGEPPPLSDLLAQLPPDPTDPSRLPLIC